MKDKIEITAKRVTYWTLEINRNDPKFEKLWSTLDREIFSDPEWTEDNSGFTFTDMHDIISEHVNIHDDLDPIRNNPTGVQEALVEITDIEVAGNNHAHQFYA